MKPLLLFIAATVAFPSPAVSQDAPADPSSGGTAITESSEATGPAGLSRGRADAAAGANSARAGAGGMGSGQGSGGDSAVNFGFVDLDDVPALGGHKELYLPPGAAWAIRFKARRVGNARNFSFGLEPRTGGDGRVRVKSAISSKPGDLTPGQECESFHPIRRVTVQQYPSVKTLIGDAPKGHCALKEGQFYYYNVYSDGGCVHPEALARGCPVLFSISNGGVTFLAPGYE